MRKVLLTLAVLSSLVAARLTADELSDDQKARAWHMNEGYKGYPRNYCAVFATEADNAARCRAQCDYDLTKGQDAAQKWCECQPGFECGEQGPPHN